MTFKVDFEAFWPCLSEGLLESIWQTQSYILATEWESLQPTFPLSLVSLRLNK